MTSDKTSTNNFNYIDQLTWLRGIAAFFVIVSHSLRASEVSYFGTDQAGSSWVTKFFDMGTFGVMLFFALSGCTLYISNANKVSANQVFSFYIKRFFRIWPAFIVTLLVYMVFSFVFAHYYGDPQGHWVEKQFLASYSFSDIVSYFTLSFNVTGPEGLFNNAFWSLPVEFQYYLVFPLIIFSLKYLGAFGPMLIGLIIYLLPKLGLFEYNESSFFMLAYSFCGGVLIGYVYQKNPAFRLDPKLSVLMLLIVMFAVFAINYLITLPAIPILGTESNWKILFALISIFVILFTKFNINKKLEAFLKHYGTISYSNYLYHNLFVAIAVLAIIKFEIENGDVKLYGILLFTLIASHFAAKVSFTYVEKPSISVGRYFVGRGKSKEKPKVTDARINLVDKQIDALNDN